MTEPASVEVQAYEALQAYTLTRGDREFRHQHVVDAWAAQHAAPDGKPIGVTFALVGLYLHVEQGFSGREVQRAHMALSRRRQAWPSFTLPEARGEMTAADVMQASEGAARDEAIHDWCRSVWEAFLQHRETVVELLVRNGIRVPRT